MVVAGALDVNEADEEKVDDVLGPGVMLAPVDAVLRLPVVEADEEKMDGVGVVDMMEACGASGGHHSAVRSLPPARMLSARSSVKLVGILV